MAPMTVADRSHALVRLQVDRGPSHRTMKTVAVGVPAVWPDLALTRITHVHDLVPTPDHPAVVGLIPILLAVIGHDHGLTHGLLAVTGLVRDLGLTRAHTLDHGRAHTLDRDRARTHAAVVTRRTPAHRHHGVAALVDPRASVGAQTLRAVVVVHAPSLVKLS